MNFKPKHIYIYIIIFLESGTSNLLRNCFKVFQPTEILYAGSSGSLPSFGVVPSGGQLTGRSLTVRFKDRVKDDGD